MMESIALSIGHQKVKKCGLKHQALITTGLPFRTQFFSKIIFEADNAQPQKLIGICLKRNFAQISYPLSDLTETDSFRSYVSIEIGSYYYYGSQIQQGDSNPINCLAHTFPVLYVLLLKDQTLFCALPHAATRRPLNILQNWSVSCLVAASIIAACILLLSSWHSFGKFWEKSLVPWSNRVYIRVRMIQGCALILLVWFQSSIYHRPFGWQQQGPGTTEHVQRPHLVRYIVGTWSHSNIFGVSAVCLLHRSV